jgi:hypothetical protein
MQLPLMLILLIQQIFALTARVFSRDSPRKVAQWTGRPIRES